MEMKTISLLVNIDILFKSQSIYKVTAVCVHPENDFAKIFYEWCLRRMLKPPPVNPRAFISWYPKLDPKEGR